MENNKTKSSAIQKILKCGIISWVAIIALWGIGSLKYDEYFLPSPKETIDSMKELIKDGTLWSDIVASVGRVIKGWLLSIIFAVPMGLIVGNFRPALLRLVALVIIVYPQTCEHIVKLHKAQPLALICVGKPVESALFSQPFYEPFFLSPGTSQPWAFIYVCCKNSLDTFQRLFTAVELWKYQAEHSVRIISDKPFQVLVFAELH